MNLKIELQLITICLFLMASVGCTTNGQPEAKASTNETITSSININDGELPQIYRGALTIAPESNYLKDCASKQDWWIEDETELLEGQYNDFASEPYQQIYAELKGYLRQVPSDGFASEYDQVFVVIEIIKLDDLDMVNNCTLEEEVN